MTMIDPMMENSRRRKQHVVDSTTYTPQILPTRRHPRARLQHTLTPASGFTTTSSSTWSFSCHPSTDIGSQELSLLLCPPSQLQLMQCQINAHECTTHALWLKVPLPDTLPKPKKYNNASIRLTRDSRCLMLRAPCLFPWPIFVKS